MLSLGDYSIDEYRMYGCMDCEYSEFYYDIMESMGNEQQRECTCKEQTWNWKGKCPFIKNGKANWSNYKEPKYN